MEHPVAWAIAYRSLKLLPISNITAKLKARFRPRSRIREAWLAIKGSAVKDEWLPPTIKPVKQPTVTRYWVEEHNAEKAGLHYDVTVQAPDGRYYRWATRDPMWDKFGTHTEMLWVLQPEHYEPTNPAVIKEGYGAGTTRLVETGKCLLYTRNNHLHIVFEGHRGTWVWLPASELGWKAEKAGGLITRMNPRKIPKIPKEHYKTVKDDKVKSYLDNPKYVAFVKKDGARANFRLEIDDSGNTDFVIGSYRLDQRAGHGENIDWTDKLRDRVSEVENGLSGGTGKKLLKSLPSKRGKVAIEGNAEVWLDDFQDLNAKLQPNDVKAFSADRKPYIYIFDITSVNGEEFQSKPYSEKLRIIEAIHDANPRTPLKVPPSASTSWGKRTLLKMASKEQGVDGVVFQNIEEREVPIKYKFRDEVTCKIVGIKQEVDTSGSPKDTAIPVVEYEGRTFPVAGKLSTETKKDILANPDNWIGKDADVSFTRMSKTEGGVPFQPILERVKED